MMLRTKRYLLPLFFMSLQATHLTAANLLGEMDCCHIYAEFAKQQPEMAKLLRDFPGGLPAVAALDHLTLHGQMRPKVLQPAKPNAKTTRYTYTFERSLGSDEQGFEESVPGRCASLAVSSQAMPMGREVISVVIDRTRTVDPLTGMPQAYMATKQDEVVIKLTRFPADPALAPLRQTIVSRTVNVASYSTDNADGMLDHGSKTRREMEAGMPETRANLNALTALDDQTVFEQVRDETYDVQPHPDGGGRMTIYSTQTSTRATVEAWRQRGKSSKDGE